MTMSREEVFRYWAKLGDCGSSESRRNKDGTITAAQSWIALKLAFAGAPACLAPCRSMLPTKSKTFW